MYKTSFYLTGNRGNNAFSFELRKEPKLFVPSLISGTVEDAGLGNEIVFEDFDENGKLQSCKGLKNLLSFDWKGVPAVLVDNHNHVLYFWYKSGLKNATLIHIDQHKDMREPAFFLKLDSQERTEENMQKVFDYTNEVLNVGNYIVPARQAGIVDKIQFVTSEMALKDEQFFSTTNKILNIDLDFFAPELDYIDFKKAKRFIDSHAKTASLITVATSPFFIEQERALQILKKLLE